MFLEPLLQTLNTIGFDAEIVFDANGQEQILAQSEALRVKAFYAGSEYVVQIGPKEENIWFDLRDLLRYIEEGSVRYSEDPAKTYLGPTEYAHVMRTHGDVITKLLTSREKRQRLKKAIKDGLDQFTRDLHTRATTSKPSKRK
jgi:hypothetical protein